MRLSKWSKPDPDATAEVDISTALHHLLDKSAERAAEHVAVEDTTGVTVSYRELCRQSDTLRDALRYLGVDCGDRVAFYLPKSVDSIISIFGIMKAGAAYVPLDPGAPAARNAYIASNCSVSAVIIDDRFVSEFCDKLGDLVQDIALIVLDETLPAPRVEAALIGMLANVPITATHDPEPEELAYILYTSGSTGKPKGVMISHENACSFVDWCSETFDPHETDRFSSHAPLHFDLSVHDVFVSIKHGATLVLIAEDTGKNPEKLARLIAERKITVWYSTPSILGLLAQFGKLDQHDYSSLRLILFAGEVFPIKHLRETKRMLAAPRYFNLYGPTETNVCTYFEIPAEVSAKRLDPYPIGRPCSHYEALVIDTDGSPVAAGEEGELVMHGPGVTPGYWKLADRTAVAFHHDPSGKVWYKTGDVVLEEQDGNYIYVGRRDRMVKKRGFRIELGEIETCLYQHPDVEEIGVVAVADEQGDLQIWAHISPKVGGRISIIPLKSFCAKRLPAYMIPDRFTFPEKLPRTSTDKVDYQKLMEISV